MLIKLSISYLISDWQFLQHLQKFCPSISPILIFCSITINFFNNVCGIGIFNVVSDTTISSMKGICWVIESVQPGCKVNDGHFGHSIIPIVNRLLKGSSSWNNLIISEKKRGILNWYTIGKHISYLKGPVHLGEWDQS